MLQTLQSVVFMHSQDVPKHIAATQAAAAAACSTLGFFCSCTSAAAAA
jgi:hypothetical protein